MNPLKERCRACSRVAPLLAAALVAGGCAVGFLGAGQPGRWGQPGQLDHPGGREQIARLFGIGALPALAFLLCAGSLFLWVWQPAAQRVLRTRRMARALGGAACVLGVIGLLHLFFRGSGADAARFFPGVVTVQEALCALLLGGALVALRWTLRWTPRDRMVHLSEFPAFFAAAVGFFALLVALYHLGYPFRNGAPGSMNLTSALVAITLAVGIFCAWTEGGLMGVLVSRAAGARQLRRLLLFAWLALPLIGWVQPSLRGKGWHLLEFEAAFLVVASLSVLTLAVLILGAGLLKAEALRRKAEHRRHLRDVDFSATFEQAAVGLAHVAPSGRFLRTNSRLSAILGYSRAEFARLSFQDITHPEDLGVDLAYFRRVLKGEISRYSTEKRYLKKDGSVVWGNLTVAVLRTPSGRAKYFISVVEDISEWKRAQEELEAAGKAKDRFISVISHELRTPLTPVLAALSSEEGAGLSDPATVEMMRRNIQHEASIINDLLDLTRISSSGKLKLELRPVDLHRLIGEVLHGIEGALQQRRLVCRLLREAPRCVVHGDPVRLRQIFLNLLDNAMKFTPPGGRITVETFLKKGEPGSRIGVRVSDTGIGIEPDNLERVFDAFEQARQTSQRRHGGLGLGLAIVKGLVEAHGGTIHAENARQGAAFVFDFRLTDQPVASAHPLPTREEDRARILLVEDHEDTRATLERLLKRRGHTVRSAATVTEAAAQLRKEPFDLLISDIGLPDGTGLELPAALHAAGRSLACIALSGFGTEEDVRKSLRAGFSHHLTKPVEMSALDAAIADIIGRRGGRRG